MKLDNFEIMNKSILTFLSLSILVFALSCKGNSNSGKEKKSKFHDIIHNPSTADETKKDNDVPVLTVPETQFIFGKVKQGETVSHKFEIANTGRSNLVILDSKSSCGCTVSEFPTEPLPPQAKSYVKVTFDTKGKSGMQEKKVSIFSNTIPNETIFVVKGEVIQ